MGLEGPRLLTKYHNNQTITVTPGEPYFEESGQGWESIDATTFVSRNYYDLSGYTVEELTLLVQNVAIQEGFSAHGSMSVAWIIDLITSEFVRDADISTAVLNFTGSMPGFLGSRFDMNQVIYGRVRTYASQTISSVPITALQHTGTTNFGTGAAFAGSKLYNTRVLFFSGLALEFISVPPAAYVIGGIVVKEKDLSYQQRLSQSFEHANRQ